MTDKDLNIIIFSKDRALQLDSLLRSLKDNFKLPITNIYVLFKHSNHEIKRAYAILTSRKYLNNIHWIAEHDFRSDLFDIFRRIKNKSLLMFLVDDNIVFREFSTSELFKHFFKNHLFLSLRASADYKESVPDFYKNTDFLEWKWTKIKEEWNTWGYPFSVDGNIYHAKIIKKLIRNISFNAPNTLEANLNQTKRNLKIRIKSKALAPIQPVIFNNPLNKVQTEWETWNANYNVDELNEIYLSGQVIDNQPYYMAKPTAVHFYIKPTFKQLD